MARAGTEEGAKALFPERKGVLPVNLIKSTLSEQIYQILRSDILNQTIHFGERLTLKNLQERFDVSSTPIREALTRLSEEELVVYYSNVGVRVIEPQKEDLRELYQFIGDLDALAITYASASKRPKELIAQLRDNISQTALDGLEHADNERIRLWMEQSDRFHLIFYDYCDNMRLTRAAERLRSQMSIFSNLYEKDLQVQKEIEACHIRIFEAYEQGQYPLAAERMRSHVMESLKFALERI